MGRSLAVIFVASVLAVGCGTTKMSMDRSDNVLAAEGQVKVKEKDGNRMLEVNVKHLAPPDRLQGDAKNYVVWVKPLDQAAAPMNVGALAINDDLEGSLKTVTPFEKFEVFVTPEPTAETVSPSGQRVLWKRVD
jgi:hypothetical protein